MKKVWIPRDALIPKPFYKQKIFVVFCLLICVSLTFLIYQVKFVSQLQNPTEFFADSLSSKGMKQTKHHLGGVVEISTKISSILRGTRVRDIENYTKRFTNQKFQCLDRSREIDWEKLNDNFCDCPDGSDETFTNACFNGRFFCTKQVRHLTGRGKDIYVPTSRINDGICDCKLDCSDEFQI